MTDDDGLNGMLAADLGQYFGHDRVYQLAPTSGDDIDFYVRSRVLFDESATYHELDARLKRGAVVDALTVQSDGQAEANDGAIAMFILSPDNLHVVVAGEAPRSDPGEELIGLTPPPG